MSSPKAEQNVEPAFKEVLVCRIFVQWWIKSGVDASLVPSTAPSLLHVQHLTMPMLHR